MKRILVLGSTGTIGVNTLKVVEQFKDRFQVLGLSAYNNVETLARQVEVFRPRYVSIHPDKKAALKESLKGLDVEILDTEADLPKLCSLNEVDIVVIGISGRAALEPFLAAAQAGKMITPANKEALVIAGDILMRVAKDSGARVVPIDSEQSAIFQCLEGRNGNSIKKIYLTASGGPLKDVPLDRFDRLTVEDILAHPRWKMGPKITVDSATMMNKGFEIIEAQRLFGISPEIIEVVVHPEAIIHSMVCFQDGSIMAQLGATDMKIPIQYALTYPDRLGSSLKDLDLFELKQLNFERPDISRFPSLALAQTVAREGQTLPAVLNAANEVAVEAFLNQQIHFSDIYPLVKNVVDQHVKTPADDMAAVLAADEWARDVARQEMQTIRKKEVH